MTQPSPQNPFAGLPPPPAGQDADAQLRYLRQVVTAFEQAGNPRLKPLKKRLDGALADLARGSQAGADAAELARDFGREVGEVKLQAYDLLSVVVNQVRATVRVKLQGGMPAPERVDMERLQKGLGLFAQGLRKLLLASKRGDASAHGAANRLIDESRELLAGPASALAEAPRR